MSTVARICVSVYWMTHEPLEHRKQRQIRAHIDDQHLNSHGGLCNQNNAREALRCARPQPHKLRCK
jgi:hypothetical protein